MKEKVIEEYLRDQVKKAGGKAYKFESPGNNGVPDRVVVFPEGRIYFVELKAPGKRLRPQQLAKCRELESLGCKVFDFDSKDAVDSFIRNVIGGVYESV